MSEHDPPELTNDHESIEARLSNRSPSLRTRSIRHETPVVPVRCNHPGVPLNARRPGAPPNYSGFIPQNYLDAAPDGIDAPWMSTQADGEGVGVALVDVEQGWFPNIKGRFACFCTACAIALGSTGCPKDPSTNTTTDKTATTPADTTTTKPVDEPDTAATPTAESIFREVMFAEAGGAARVEELREIREMSGGDDIPKESRKAMEDIIVAALNKRDARMMESFANQVTSGEPKEVATALESAAAAIIEITPTLSDDAESASAALETLSSRTSLIAELKKQKNLQDSLRVKFATRKKLTKEELALLTEFSRTKPFDLVLPVSAVQQTQPVSYTHLTLPTIYSV